MIVNFRFDSLLKTAALCTFGAVLLSACGDKKDGTASAASTGQSSYEVPGDHVLGSPDAPITVVEYASVTCSHCATWNTTVWPHFEKKYVNTGKVRFVFREFPTPPADLAMAGHLIANCAVEDKFFDIIHLQFKRQREILTSSDIKGEYTRLAKTAGVDFDACMENTAERERLIKVIDHGSRLGVGVTPTFIINGKIADKVYDMDSFDKAFAETLGEPAPKPSEETGDTPAGDGH